MIVSPVYHYEFIAGREDGHQYRVADEMDDFISDFATEDEAREYVRNHNRRVGKERQWAVEENGWKYA